ncbi:MAG TPA: glycosyltransferase 87 family protein [Bryobacteraceae bacterium]|nr:glycosyltransferase 87 family protein [Bryobacteraceae bacterium]
MLRWLLRCGALAGIAFVLFPAVRQGWTHVETDFPNYYTAAALARKHAPLRKFYDWTWFQRQMNYAGWEHQLGGYIPHSPLTMLPILPLAGLPPMTAKRVWVAANVAFLFAAIALLANLSGIPASGLIVLATAGYAALQPNFIFGQYYVFILFLLSLGFWLLLGEREFSAGAVLGAVFVTKLYAGPFLVYFAWKRRWRAVAGMLASCAALGLVSIWLYGWKDNLYYVTSVLPRALVAETNDPYALGLTTVSNMLRHAFVFSPTLNPHPIANAPAAAFFIQTLVTLAAPVFCILALPGARKGNRRREVALFLVMLLFASPNRVQYMSVMLLAVIALVWNKASVRGRVALVLGYLAMSLPAPGSWMIWFPSVWILLAWFLASGAPYFRELRPAVVAIASAAILCAATFTTYRRMASYGVEPPAILEPVAARAGAIYSASPAASKDGVVYESIAHERYELEHWNAGTRDTYSFDGEAFHPAVAPSGGSIYFELVSGGHSRIMAFDPPTRGLSTVVSSDLDPTHPAISPDERLLAFLAGGRILIHSGGMLGAIDVPGPVHDLSWFPDSGRIAYSAGPLGESQLYSTDPPDGAPIALTHDSGDHTEPAVSPDGRWLAYTLERGATRQVWIREFASGSARQITWGACNSYSPTWEPDSRSLILASDCELGLNLPALYRWTFDKSGGQNGRK